MIEYWNSSGPSESRCSCARESGEFFRGIARSLNISEERAATILGDKRAYAEAVQRRDRREYLASLTPQEKIRYVERRLRESPGGEIRSSA